MSIRLKQIVVFVVGFVMVIWLLSLNSPGLAFLMLVWTIVLLEWNRRDLMKINEGSGR